jgi:molybdopterin-guanine dinucleotide biosynthesis protein A
MGQEKALLDWHGQTAVERAVTVAREGVDGGPVCVVRAPGQKLPALDAIVVDDEVAFDGPLAALHTGLAAVRADADVAFACGVDTPLLRPAFVRAVLRLLRKGDDGVVPTIGGRSQWLLAAYRVGIVPHLQSLLDDGAYGLREIPRLSAVRQVTEWELISDPALDEADPRLDSALNANTPEEWAALVARVQPA